MFFGGWTYRWRFTDEEKNITAMAVNFHFTEEDLDELRRELSRHEVPLEVVWLHDQD